MCTNIEQRATQKNCYSRVCSWSSLSDIIGAAPQLDSICRCRFYSRATRASRAAVCVAAFHLSSVRREYNIFLSIPFSRCSFIRCGHCHPDCRTTESNRTQLGTAGMERRTNYWNWAVSRPAHIVRDNLTSVIGKTVAYRAPTIRACIHGMSHAIGRFDRNRCQHANTQ